VVRQPKYPVLDHLGGWRRPPFLCGPRRDAAYDRLGDRMVDYIEQQPPSAWLPSVKVSGGGPPTEKVGCNRYHRPDHGVDAVTSVVSFDIRGGEPSMVSIYDDAQVVYASPRHLYIVATADPGVVDDLGHLQPATKDNRVLSAVHRFALDGAVARYAGSGLIPGEPLNQFALDEHEGRLRVASHGGTSENSITVLADNNGSLTIQGALLNIAPGEDIRSARFVGPRGYLVTFRKIDPLFAIDLAGAAPKLLGELKIPGYATYIHPLDPHRLLTVGFGASDPDQPSINDAVRLQLVDVQDPRTPQLAHVEVIGKRGSTSAAQHEHLAFNYFAPKELLLLPINVRRQLPDEPETSFNGLMAYRVSMQEGFNLVGSVPSPDGWSTKRTIVMDDYVLSFSRTTLKINHLTNLAKTVAEVRLDNSGSKKP
jgi:uncharacterized secreted protein with C-terminal beta-propeller domain